MSSSILKPRIAPFGPRAEFMASAPPGRKTPQTADSVWVILVLVFIVTGTFFAINQLCGLLAERMQQMQRQ